MAEHAGHRQRMFSRLNEGTLCEHEYLEMLLFYAIPRRNTNDLAHRLLARFRDLNGVLNASEEELREVEGIGENATAMFALLGKLCEQYRPYSITDGTWPARYDRNTFISFVKSQYSQTEMQLEYLDVYLVDDVGEFYGCRRFGGKKVKEVSVSADAIGELLWREQPSGIVIVHNHPSRDPTPSPADDETTKWLIMLCNLHKSLLFDHVIYAQNGIYSYFKAGRLMRFAEELKNQR